MFGMREIAPAAIDIMSFGRGVHEGVDTVYEVSGFLIEFSLAFA